MPATILPIPFKNQKLNLLAAITGTGVAFVVVLAAGFQIHKRSPAISDNVLGVSLGIAILAIALLIAGVAFHLPRRLWSLARVPIARRAHNEAKREYEAYKAYRARRIAELEADPAKRKYGKLMKHGRDWSDDQIAYDQNLNLTATCPHLKPIEHAIRMTGIRTLLQTKSWKEKYTPLAVVVADCSVNQAEMKRLFALPECVSYAEGYLPERSALDNPFARVNCIECRSTIELVHPEWPRPGTRWFPAEP